MHCRSQFYGPDKEVYLSVLERLLGQVSLKQKCPFWTDDSRCAMRYCHIEPCLDADIPEGLKGHQSRNGVLEESPSLKYSEEAQSVDCDRDHDHDHELGFLNTTIRQVLTLVRAGTKFNEAAYKEFARWKAYDDAQDNFCVMNEEDKGAEYVDLLLNPERYTGYKGKSAHRIWDSIYLENCFRPKDTFSSYIQSSRLNEKNTLGLDPPGGQWGPNLQEFKRRFDPETSNGEGPQWLRNLYFLYLLELRALAKAAPYLDQEEYYTGNEDEDKEVKFAIHDFLKVVRSFPDHFNESSMFSGGQQARKLKDEFRQHFRNISRIMDCVGCDKCKLWGKLQIHGLGTALKILFSGKFDGMDLTNANKSKFQLQRSEIVALFNAFGSPDLESGVLHLFGLLKKHLGVKQFNTDMAIQQAVMMWI
ncbi:hypothetical protein ANN_11340 [Periplaneta americana]|uniref:Ero1-like protein n=1 Tax=Periplaneta americana TaxID=6978 RepID=A0ABQ8T6H6_PERAM|nr:hypothetical protein ANN_11340 [Periplaneta americana]